MMTLEDYMKALETCPDEMTGSETVLYKKLGVYDNYDVMLSEKFGKVVEDFCTLRGTFELKHFRGLQCFLDYTQKSAGINISRNRFHTRNLAKTHPVIIMIYPRRFGQKSNIANYPLTEQHRNIAEIIQQIGRYVLCEKIPAVFRGSYYEVPEDILEGKTPIVYEPGNSAN